MCQDKLVIMSVHMINDQNRNRDIQETLLISIGFNLGKETFTRFKIKLRVNLEMLV